MDTLVTRIVKSTDGVTTAYDVSGRGPALMLLHGGFVQDRKTWHEVGYVNRLKDDFTVIAVDLRGHGDSDKPESPESYAPDNFLADLVAVADACGAERFFLWGYSLGGTIALHASRRLDRILGSALGGVWFGRIFTEAMINAALARGEAVATALTHGTLGDLSLSQQEQVFYSGVNIRAVLAWTRALGGYPAIEPGELICPALVYAGAENAMATAKLKEKSEEIEAAGVRLQIYHGLDHAQEFSKIDQVFAPIRSFFKELGA